MGIEADGGKTYGKDLVMKEIKIGLIGLGFMGRTHWNIYKAMPGARVVALSDIDPDKRRGDVSKVVGNIGGNGDDNNMKRET